MSKLVRWENAIFLSVALIITGFLAYGIYRTANALIHHKESQTTSDYLSSGSSSASYRLASDGTFCNPYGCAGCSGCVSLTYVQNVQDSPSLATQVEQSD